MCSIYKKYETWIYYIILCMKNLEVNRKKKVFEFYEIIENLKNHEINFEAYLVSE